MNLTSNTPKYKHNCSACIYLTTLPTNGYDEVEFYCDFYYCPAHCGESLKTYYSNNLVRRWGDGPGPISSAWMNLIHTSRLNHPVSTSIQRTYGQALVVACNRNLVDKCLTDLILCGDDEAY